MANNSQNNEIINSWSLVSFARSHGRMKIAPFVNKDTGESFTSCAFVDGTGSVNTLVAFSSNLGELNAKQIIQQKDDLQVVELSNGKFKLCKKGSSSWEDVDLGI